MKILILQLARLGDVLMTWPSVRALRRNFPDAEIQILVRPRFEAALRRLEGVDRVRLLPTTEFIEPLISGDNDSLANLRVANFLNDLREEKFDKVINLSFSPVSSWIVKSIASPHALVRGYTRHEDGWLSIADDVSSYFYAQVGPGRDNRIHLSDLFAAITDVDLAPEDWSPPRGMTAWNGNSKDVVVHVGASETGKRVPAFIWGRALKRFNATHPGMTFTLIGTTEEKHLAQEISANAGSMAIRDLTGKTKFEELFEIVRDAKFLIGGDSAPMHIAALSGTPCLNVSVGDVNFWETGPRSKGSGVLRFERIEDVTSERIADSAVALMEGREVENVYRSIEGIPAFEGPSADTAREFAWNLAAAVYLEAPFPVADDLKFVLGVEKIREMNNVVLQQLENVSPKAQILGDLMDRADEVLRAIAKEVPECGVLVRWTMSEKSRIPPGSQEQVRQSMAQVHERLGSVLKIYDMDAIEGSGGMNGAS